MKIAHIIDSLYYGGAQKLEVIFAREIQRMPEHTLTIISLFESGENNFQKDLESAGANVVTFHADQGLKDISRWKNLYHYLSKEKFDVIHSHLLYANIMGAGLGFLTNTPVVASIHNERYDANENKKIRRQIERFFLKRLCTRLIAVGYAVQNSQAARFSPKAMVVIPNAISQERVLSPEDRVEKRKSLIGEGTGRIVISVGALINQKGYFDLVEAFSQVISVRPNSYLIIAGDGPLKDQLNTQIMKYGLTRSVFLLGERHDIPELLSASDLYVSSSHWEGLPIAVLEGMIAGLPIVATDVGDISRVVVEGTGVVVPPGQPGELSRAILGYLAEESGLFKAGKNARKFVADNYNARDWVEDIIKLYVEAIK